MLHRISKEAANDLEKTWLYTFEKWSIRQADRYFNLLMEEIEHLSKNPCSGKDYGKVKKGYFRVKVKSHFIFYRVNRDANEIEIIRILHQRMDIENIL